jgi:hypothetical protein
MEAQLAEAQRGREADVQAAEERLSSFMWRIT